MTRRLIWIPVGTTAALIAVAFSMLRGSASAQNRSSVQNEPSREALLTPVTPIARQEGGMVDGAHYNFSRRILKVGSRQVKTVNLSFDDGPFPASCTLILDTLRRKRVKATFFVVGRQVDGNPDLTKRILADGHELANHTYDHLRLDTLPRNAVYEQIKRCDEAVERLTDKRMLFFRPPGMRFNETVIDVMKGLDHTMVSWNIGAKDFIGTVPDYELTPELRKLPNITPKLVVERVVKQLKPGGLILLHDNLITAEALDKLIDAVHAEGYTFSGCSEMMANLPERVITVANPPCIPAR